MTVSVCVGSSCHLKGSRQVIDRLRELLSGYGLTDSIELEAALCMDNCMNGVCVTVDGKPYSLSPDTTEEFFRTELLARAAGSDS
jgi:NADH:ubiquinone oxidoreductase subunit E